MNVLGANSATFSNFQGRNKANGAIRRQEFFKYSFVAESAAMGKDEKVDEKEPSNHGTSAALFHFDIGSSQTS